ncbi:hypothetical protein G9G63_25980 [Paenibacillus sp. EKM202P]|uniref:hypothetical protein n=1 Tax=unclassified Paenibacillus TaxID=185978 RepID=UPI0013EC87A8|nr:MULTISPECIES: hypothetical protein [unclassified Paenibacillus]KAF6558319.1 hypothetical protein G9G63_25980 [Paenibacillus sp. EKM202P]KAF6563251.1 hypothetical protein G9G64_25865 [Paenibacillus sp. EKM207P]
MKNKDRIIAQLSNVELCDDCLSIASGVTPRQTVYSICRALFEASYIIRKPSKCEYCHRSKITSKLLDTKYQKEGAPLPSSANFAIKPWYWEGNVQGHVVSYLVQNKYQIRSVADTASRTTGKDIIALTPDGKELWVSVKGYPEKSSNVQARHWFSGALFDLILYHGENAQVKLGIALPGDFSTYTNLLPRIKWLKDLMQFEVYWVTEEGIVTVE